MEYSNRNYWTTLFLLILFGYAGIHLLYLGRKKHATIYFLLMFLVLPAIFFYLRDLTHLLTGRLKDGGGKTLPSYLDAYKTTRLGSKTNKLSEELIKSQNQLFQESKKKVEEKREQIREDQRIAEEQVKLKLEKKETERKQIQSASISSLSKDEAINRLLNIPRKKLNKLSRNNIKDYSLKVGFIDKVDHLEKYFEYEPKESILEKFKENIDNLIIELSRTYYRKKIYTKTIALLLLIINTLTAIVYFSPETLNSYGINSMPKILENNFLYIALALYVISLYLIRSVFNNIVFVKEYTTPRYPLLDRINMLNSVLFLIIFVVISDGAASIFDIPYWQLFFMLLPLFIIFTRNIRDTTFLFGTPYSILMIPFWSTIGMAILIPLLIMAKGAVSAASNKNVQKTATIAAGVYIGNKLSKQTKRNKR
jgi:TM2 domain-containing membrane protein YozV